MDPVKRCVRCGQPLKLNNRFCSACGGEQPIAPVNRPPQVPPPNRGHQPPKKGGSSLHTVILIVLCLGIVLLTALIVYLVKSSDNSESESTIEKSIYDNISQELAKIVEEGKPEVEPMETVDHTERVAAPNVRIEWLPGGFTEVFGQSSLVAADQTAISKIRDLCDGRTITLSGTFSDYPIVMELNILSDGKVGGRYAYRSTLEKYGRGKSSWFKFAGQLLSDKWSNDLYMGIVTTNPENGNTFEYALFECSGGYTLNLSGRLCNIKYLADPDGHWYKLYLSQDRFQPKGNVNARGRGDSVRADSVKC